MSFWPQPIVSSNAMTRPSKQVDCIKLFKAPVATTESVFTAGHQHSPPRRGATTTANIHSSSRPRSCVRGAPHRSGEWLPLGCYFIPQQNRAGGYTKPIGFYSRLVLDSKKALAFTIFGPLREKLGKRLLYPVGSFFP